MFFTESIKKQKEMDLSLEHIFEEIRLLEPVGESTFELQEEIMIIENAFIERYTGSFLFGSTEETNIILEGFFDKLGSAILEFWKQLKGIVNNFFATMMRILKSTEKFCQDHEDDILKGADGSLKVAMITDMFKSIKELSVSKSGKNAENILRELEKQTKEVLKVSSKSPDTSDYLKEVRSLKESFEKEKKSIADALLRENSKTRAIEVELSEDVVKNAIDALKNESSELEFVFLVTKEQERIIKVIEKETKDKFSKIEDKIKDKKNESSLGTKFEIVNEADEKLENPKNSSSGDSSSNSEKPVEDSKEQKLKQILTAKEEFLKVTGSLNKFYTKLGGILRSEYKKKVSYSWKIVKLSHNNYLKNRNKKDDE